MLVRHFDRRSKVSKVGMIRSNIWGNYLLLDDTFQESVGGCIRVDAVILKHTAPERLPFLKYCYPTILSDQLLKPLRK